MAKVVNLSSYTHAVELETDEPVESPLFPVVGKVMYERPPEGVAVTPHSFHIYDSEAEVYVSGDSIAQLIYNAEAVKFRFELHREMLSVMREMSWVRVLRLAIDHELAGKVFINLDGPFPLLETFLYSASELADKLETCTCQPAEVVEEASDVLEGYASPAVTMVLDGVGVKYRWWACPEGVAVKVGDVCVLVLRV